MKIFFLSLCYLSLRATAATTFLSVACPNTTTPFPTASFQSNLHALLSTLPSTASTFGFFNSTAGATHGLFLCRGDVSATVCRDCVATAAKEAPWRCPTSKTATIWYDECMLRYSDRPIFSVTDQSDRVILYNTQKLNEPDRLRDLLGEVMNDVVRRASEGRFGKKFATREANFSALQELYALAQCTPDLASSDCEECLRDAVASFPSCCDGRRGGRVLFPSCNVRFEFYPFYNVSAAPPLSEASPATPEGEKSNPFPTFETIMFLTPVVFFFVTFFWLLKKTKEMKKHGRSYINFQRLQLLSETESFDSYDEMRKEMTLLQLQLTECKGRITELEKQLAWKP